MSTLRKDLRAMCADGAAWSMMVGIGESYLPAFVLALTANPFACGLVATVPMLLGSILQLATPGLIRRAGSYRLWVVICAVIQAAAFLPLIFIAFWGYASLGLVFAFASLYWAAGLATTPPWNAWAETLVPAPLRATFFARRARVSQFGLILGFAGGGLLLETYSRSHDGTALFAALFLIAMVCRLVSARFLACQSDQDRSRLQSSQTESFGLLRSLRKNIGSRLLRFLLAMQLAAWIAGPYFTPYMFLHLHLSYGEYMVLACTAFFGKMACFPILGACCRRLGTHRILWGSSLLIAITPALWLVHDGYAYLIALQLLAGAAWAGLEFATLLLLFETIPVVERIGTLTVFNFVNAAALTIGSLIGGVILAAVPNSTDAYTALFWISTLVRGGSLLFLFQLSKISVPAWNFVTRSIALRPNLGSMERPILAILAQPPKSSAFPVEHTLIKLVKD